MFIKLLIKIYVHGYISIGRELRASLCSQSHLPLETLSARDHVITREESAIGYVYYNYYEIYVIKQLVEIEKWQVVRVITGKIDRIATQRPLSLT